MKYFVKGKQKHIQDKELIQFYIYSKSNKIRFNNDYLTHAIREASENWQVFSFLLQCLTMICREKSKGN